MSFYDIGDGSLKASNNDTTLYMSVQSMIQFIT